MQAFGVAAGIPTTGKAVEIVEGLNAAEIKHGSIEPGSVDEIRQVIHIAADNPTFPIVMRGRAGGCQSFEGFHQSLLATCGAIREALTSRLLLDQDLEVARTCGITRRVIGASRGLVFSRCLSMGSRVG